MEKFYKKIKIDEVLTVGRRITTNIHNSNSSQIVATLAETKNMSVILMNSNGEIELYANNIEGAQAITSVDTLKYYLLAMQAKQHDGEYLYYGDPFAKRMEEKNLFYQRGGLQPHQASDVVTYTKIIDDQQTEKILFVTSTIVPVNATVSTIRKQLLYVTIIMLIVAFLLAFLIAKKIGDPIIRINKKAKELAKNTNEELTFDAKDYLEIAELSDTLSYTSKELAKTEALRRELIANVSHDLRTPLTLICGYAEMMRDLPGENTPENTQIIIEEATRLSALVNDMLDLSKLQAGTQAMERVPYSLTQNIQNIMKRYVALTEQEGYEITFYYDEEVMVNGDALKISQVVYNLINNAINYTGDDKRVAVRQKIVNNKVRIEVTDTGEGIAEENLPYIWDRYYKVDKTHKRAAIGTGLGLSIVQNILKAHHATYGVISERGKGSTFWFEMDRYFPNNV